MAVDPKSVQCRDVCKLKPSEAENNETRQLLRVAFLITGGDCDLLNTDAEDNTETSSARVGRVRTRAAIEITFGMNFLFPAARNFLGVWQTKTFVKLSCRLKPITM